MLVIVVVLNVGFIKRCNDEHYPVVDCISLVCEISCLRHYLINYHSCSITPVVNSNQESTHPLLSRHPVFNPMSISVL